VTTETAIDPAVASPPSPPGVLTPPATCLKSDAAWSGAASLATLSALHGVAVTLLEVPTLSHMRGEISNQEGTVLVMGRALGYESVAMEGEYENLPEVSLPMLVAFREGEQERYAILFAVSETEATVGDPITGEVSVWPRARFAGVWTGSVVQLTLMDDERRALAARLVELRDHVRQALRAIGWGPPYGRKLAMLAAWVAVFAAAASAPASGALGAAWVWILAAACAGSLWSWLASESCGSCSYAHQLAGGLPLAMTGTGLYALLLSSVFAPVPSVASSLAIGGAVGAHAALVRELAKAKVACWACLFVAACAVAGALVAILSGASVGAFVGAAVVVSAATALVLPRARARQARTWRSTAERIARAVIAEPRRNAEGEAAPTRLVAFTRKGCTACAFFHAAIKPALLATFNDAIAIDERDLGSANAVAPILIVLGAPPTVFVGLPLGDSCARVLETTKQAVEGGAVATPGAPGGSSQDMIVVDS
jgi:hypothetical protein